MTSYLGYDKEQLATALVALSRMCHEASFQAGWWLHPGSSIDLRQEPYKRYTIATKLALIHSEVSEAMEGYRKDLPDDKLPHRSMIETELADVLIRVFDLAGALDLNLGEALIEKVDFNAFREDHKIKHRSAAGGKKF